MDFDTLHALGVTALAQGNPEKAISLLSQAVELNPNNVYVHSNLGSVFRRLNRLEEALVCHDRALQIQPDYAVAYYNRGNVFLDLQQYQEALANYNRAVEINPQYAEVYYNRGKVLQSLDLHAEALASYEQLLKFKPNELAGLNNRGNVLVDLLQFEEALMSYDQALSLKPDYVTAWNNRGNVLQYLNRHTEAIASYDRALALQPDLSEASMNRGNALRSLNRHSAALDSYHHALRFRPDYAEAHFNESLCRLLIGDFAQAWQQYEWRWKSQQLAASKHHFSQPLWLGQEPLQGKTILLHAEQGLGDTIQFCRYAKLIARKGATVLLGVQATLKPLLGNLEGVDKVLAIGEPLPAFDYHCPLLSLPLALQTRPDTIPADVPYLRAHPEKIASWQARLQREMPLSQAPHLKVGLVWAGRTRKESKNIDLMLTDKRRSLRLAQLAPLGQVKGISFYSLQKGEGAHEAQNPPVELSIIDYTADLHDFTDTAAFIMNLDLVISVDTSVVHLAGALGKSVWLLNRFDTCWRWMLDKEDSPWYPTMQVFRQQQYGDWDGVIESVIYALNQLRGAL